MLSLKQMMEFAAASDAVDFATARRSLPIAYLMETHGFPVTQDGQRLVALCPFHDDSKPSLSIFGSDVERFNCWSCSAKGDSIDMLIKFEPDLLGEDGKYGRPLFERIRQLITAVIDENWTGPSGVSEAKPFDIQQASEIVEQAQLDVSFSRVEEFLAFKREQRGADAWPFSADGLIDRWRVGTYHHWLIIPYYTVEGELLAYKRWTEPSETRKAASGAAFSGHLYGEHLPDDGERPIIMLEGESDTWFADCILGDEYRVLGLPTGVNSSTEPAASMSGRVVYLAFDGDGDEERGGRHATKIWAEALEKAGAYVQVVPVPEGRDFSTAGVPPRILLNQARPPSVAPPQIQETPGGYTTDQKGKPTPISNFVFVPKRGLHGENMSAFEGILKPGGDPAVLQDADIQNDTKMSAWATRYGRSWWGSSKDARMLQAVLQAKEVYLPSGRLVTVAGLHKGTFVWPGGKIGPEPVVYVPPSTGDGLGDKLKIAAAPWDPSLIHMLRDVQSRKQTDPLLAWLALAPYRSVVPSFPFVMVTGAKGAGKSQTAKLFTQLFSGSSIGSTFSGTVFPMKDAFRATNAFPQIADEYRPGGKKETIDAVEQLLREAYDQQSSRMAGLSAAWAQITEMIPSAPTIIAGENEFQEGSHVDRMIPLRFREEGQNLDLFGKLHQLTKHGTGFPLAWLTFLYGRLVDAGNPTEIEIAPYTAVPLPPRQQHNLGLLDFGWRLLQEFMSENNDTLDEPDFSEVVKELVEANKHTPIEDALLWTLSEPEAWFVKKKNGELWVEVHNFFAYISDPRRAVLFKMPGGMLAIRHYIEDRLGARTEREDQREWTVFPFSKIERR